MYGDIGNYYKDDGREEVIGEDDHAAEGDKNVDKESDEEPKVKVREKTSQEK